ncbi:hypothetical protein ABID22_003173 [Pontibacter aydingkolensis]|uniref:DUF4175 domain-containing protein n=1 Tax=Pontibacter aydingkolensis TaxID=1911536 RepID=A0ABS7CYI7_9BACT|nr:DUF4175 domain-containing protein [Pontibacter aydingkolensis]MBW7468751.1 DUF4175 domain-containing protein [Pontibacter aydingkolensis]
MKNLLFATTAFLLLVSTGCQRTDDARVMLHDKNERREVYATILDNEEMRNEMMDMMGERNMSGPMGRGGMMQGGGMMGDTMRMGGMNRQQMQVRMQEMMAQCETDTAACNMMAQMMMQHRGMMGNMMQRMQQRGMVDSDCYQQMMNNMKTK